MLVGEHYSFDRSNENVLGRGGFGVVYKGYDKRDDNVVAVKEISEAILNMSNVERENEIIRLLKSISHENIVTHYHIDCKDGSIFMVMEFCNYEDLEKYYDKHAPLNWSDMNIILRQLASGLQTLYSNRIIHRDLKPTNILLHNNKNLQNPLINDLTLKIADFGTSRFVSNSTLASSVVGSLIYMAPEIYTQETYDHKADVWSVGLIVYRGLFGKLPEFLNPDEFTFNFWSVLHSQNKEPKIEFPFCESLKLKQLLRKLLIHDVASRMNMLNFLNLILTEEPGNNRNVIIVKRLDEKALISDPRLLSATRENNIDLVRTLLEQCVDPNIKDDYENTALHKAAENKDDDKGLVELLLEYGADIDSQNEDDYTCLMYAAINNNIEIVRCLLQNGADIDSQYGRTCLMYAVENKNIEIVHCLLQNGADINKKDSDGKNALHYAARNENDNKLIIELLLKNGADINSQDENGVTCLMKAAGNNNIEIVRCLLQNGADINIKCYYYGSNALHYAARNTNDNKFIIKLLLEYGADIDDEGGGTCLMHAAGGTCLMHAARSNNIEIVRYLLQNGADINRENVLHYAAINKNDNKLIIELLVEYGADINNLNKDGETCLMWAARNNNIEIVRYLLQNGADINIKSNQNKWMNEFNVLHNVLHYAAINTNDNKLIIELLLEYGAEIESQDKDGYTCLMWAAVFNNIEIVRCLLQNGADIDSQDKFGGTCLMTAAGNNKIEIVRFLLQNGANPNKKGNNGGTALHKAARNKNDNKFIIELLLEYGADIDSQDKSGFTCLMYAVENNKIEIVRCLLQNGADPNRKNSNGDTALHKAAENKDDDKLVELLLEYGADIDSQNPIGRTCLMYAAFKNNIKIVHCLLQNGADIDSQDKYSETCLMFAARNKNIETVRCLLQNGADINKQNRLGETAIQIARSNRRGNREIVELLLNYEK